MRNLGIARTGEDTVRSDSQGWLQQLAKRWIRLRLSSGIGAGSANKAALATTRFFSQFLASPAVAVDRLDQVDRALLERFLADLHTELAGRKVHADRVSQLHLFLQTIRRHGWDDSLPANATGHANPSVAGSSPARPTTKTCQSRFVAVRSAR